MSPQHVGISSERLRRAPPVAPPATPPTRGTPLPPAPPPPCARLREIVRDCARLREIARDCARCARQGIVRVRVRARACASPRVYATVCVRPRACVCMCVCVCASSVRAREAGAVLGGCGRRRQRSHHWKRKKGRVVGHWSGGSPKGAHQTRHVRLALSARDPAAPMTNTARHPSRRPRPLAGLVRARLPRGWGGACRATPCRCARCPERVAV